MVECLECGLAYLPEVPSTEALYSKHYYGRRSGISNWVFEPFNRFWTRRKARRLLALESGRRWLDYGCGRGDLLDALAAQGCQTWGVETQSDHVARLAEESKGRIRASLSDLAIADGELDGVTFYHVLEHLENPRDALQTLRRLARPGAVLFVAVPNWLALERRLFHDRWFHFDVPRHIQHFSSNTLRRLLEQTGWAVRRVEFKTTAYDVFGLFQTLLNLGPGPRNFFYRLFKRGERFSVADECLAGAWTLLAAPVAALIAFLATPVLARFGRTGTFEIVACAHGPREKWDL
jgi:SAM-dependent methyltransferase